MVTYPLFSKGKVYKMHIKDLNLNEIWQDSFGWKGANVNPRKLDDDLERSFWVNLAPRYTKEYNLNNDTPLLAEALSKRIEKDSTILEIGPGSGNFTLLMAKYAKKVIGVDFSNAMLEQLSCRTQEKCIDNIELINAKWEDYAPLEKVDYIVSVNSLYRIRDMKSALKKMYENVNKGIILLRSIQRPYFYELYKELDIECDICLDYQLLPMYFWQQDIHANVEFLDYCKKKCFVNIEAVKKEIKMDLGEEVFNRNHLRIINSLEKYRISAKEGLSYSLPRTTVVISIRK